MSYWFRLYNVMKFNPYHDAHGRFTTGPSSHHKTTHHSIHHSAHKLAPVVGGKYQIFDSEELKNGHDPLRKMVSAKVLSSKEKAALNIYVGEEYAAINNFLRGKSKKLDFGDEYGAAGKHVVELMESATSKMHVPENITVYRGISGAAIKAIGPAQVGKTFTEKGFVSTSIDPSVASHWTGAGKPSAPASQAVVIRIAVSKGTPGVYVPSLSSLDGRFGEHEYLFPPNAKFTITGVSRGEIGGTKRTIYDAKLSYHK